MEPKRISHLIVELQSLLAQHGDKYVEAYDTVDVLNGGSTPCFFYSEEDQQVYVDFAKETDPGLEPLREVQMVLGALRVNESLLFESATDEALSVTERRNQEVQGCEVAALIEKYEHERHMLTGMKGACKCNG